ncbi:alcohol acetyltransferase-domain-containing protein [Emericellopsis atlantica]|uniref:Alcohol acetyltransferase-domain-containing protein n=1 Tax=Emericellopsis atlantica TaxID=2614577 RepID=A0A9P7ZNY6_9HYPO|nr:alcohol acetyltransferase-domain-containing protein [Emericellopsis atlantica]KAG9255520.1 alcohol acetyltransferase-domain-containing protein [Emericellopsis atlantica]
MAAVDGTKKTHKGASPMVVRPLGHMERYMAALYTLKAMCATVISCRYVVPQELRPASEHSALQQTIIRAVAQTTLNHPLMQVGIIKESTKQPYWVRLDSIDFDKITEWHTVPAEQDYATAVEDVLNEQIDRRFEERETRPGWRLVVTRTQGGDFVDVMWAFNHTIADGMSAKIFHEDLLSFLDDPTQKPDRPVNLHGNVLLLGQSTGPFTPPQNKLANFSSSPGFAIQSAWDELKPSFMSKPTYTQKQWGPFQTSPTTTNRTSILIDADKSKRIVAACRKNGATVTSMLNGIVFASLYHELKDMDGQPSLSGSTAVDQRRFLGSSVNGVDPKRMVNNLVTMVAHDFTEEDVLRITKNIGTQDPSQGLAYLEPVVWEVAGLTRGHVQERLDKGFKDDIMSLMGLVGDWRSEVTRSMKKPRRESWQVTNLGVIDGHGGSAEGGWHISRAMFSLSAELCRSLFILSCFGVKGGEISVDITWQDGLNELVQRVGERLTTDTLGWCNWLADGEWKEDGGLKLFRP